MLALLGECQRHRADPDDQRDRHEPERDRGLPRADPAKNGEARGHRLRRAGRRDPGSDRRADHFRGDRTKLVDAHADAASEPISLEREAAQIEHTRHAPTFRDIDRRAEVGCDLGHLERLNASEIGLRPRPDPLVGGTDHRDGRQRTLVPKGQPEEDGDQHRQSDDHDERSVGDERDEFLAKESGQGSHDSASFRLL